MKKKLSSITLRKTVSIFLILLTLTFNPAVTFAQTLTDATESASTSGDISVTSVTSVQQPENNTQDNSANPFFDSQVTTPPVTSETLLKDSLNVTQAPSGPNQSAVPVAAAKVQIENLFKKTFKNNENVVFSVANAKADTLKVEVFDAQGHFAKSVRVQKTSQGDGTEVSVIPPFGLKPGKYTVKATDPSGNTTTQDFSWGVLAINSPKSIYHTNETADFQMAVLDEFGEMVCDAQVTLVVTDPAGVKKTLSTDDNSITVNPQCLSHNFSLIPDYEAHYQVGDEGHYTLDLTATTKNGTYSIKDGIDVSSSSPFDVTRTTATRIYPAFSYPVKLSITANEDFNGRVAEFVPSNFEISPYASRSGTVASYESTALPNEFKSIEESFGVKELSLSLPFHGKHVMTQGFGDALTDPEEKDLYAKYGLAGHDGLDFDMPTGTPVFAADEGDVVLAANDAYGLTVVIQHSWGRSYYGHLSKALVTKGQHVKKGEQIALSGDSGLSSGPHLHFGIKPENPVSDNGYYGKVNPLPFLGLVSANSDILGVSNSGDNVTSKIITWQVNLKKGESIDLGYNYKAPAVSPQLYNLGPLSFFAPDKSLLFKEGRSWQIAVDADSTAGPTNCATGANDSSIAGTAWTNPANACDSNSANRATVSVSGVGTTQALKGTMGANAFSIPSTAVIHGITVSITRTGGSSGSNTTVDNAIRLVKAGTIQSTDKSTGTAWSTTETTVTYGISTDLWGGTWAPSDVNLSTFGAAVSAKGSSSSGNKTVSPSVNHIAITITYNQVPGTPTLSTTNVTATSGQLQATSTDPESDNVQYYVRLYSTNTACTNDTSPIETGDQGASQSAWSGAGLTTCTVSNDCYTSASQGTYQIQATLTQGTTYYFKARAIDPSGSNTYGSYSSCSNFTTVSTGPTLDLLLRHGEWFSNGVRQPFTF